MAKVKVLNDRVVIISNVLTDENIEKVSILAPSTLILVDEKDESKVLYQVCKDEYNSFTSNGAAFKDGKSVGTIDESILSADNKDQIITNILTKILTRINAIETQVEEYLEDAVDLSTDIEFLD